MPLAHVTDVNLTGGSSRFDYQSLDAKRHRLFIAHLGANQVVVVDVRRRRVVATVGGIASPHGVLVVPEIDRVFVAATGTRQLVALREHDLRVVWRAAAGQFPDGVAYDPRTRLVFVSDESGGRVLAFSLRGGARRSVDLGGDAGNVQYDAVSKRILAASGAEKLAAIDPGHLRVTSRFALPGCEGAHGVHLDAPRRLAFVACEDNAKLLVLDLRTGGVTGTFDVGGGPDVLDFDPGLRRLYVAAESGDDSVFVERGRTLAVLGRGRVADRAHSVAVDPATHLVYFPLENGPVLRIMRATDVE